MIAADSREIPLADKCVHCVITSPPYWGLRDYGLPGQLGLERTPQLYLAEMRKAFREVWRVLRDDGTAWVNMGDSYHNGDKGGYAKDRVTAEDSMQRSNLGANFIGAPNRQPQLGLKPKDLCGIPWRLAFALQEDGWYLRSDIIWAKPNPMPENVTDRPTKSHEYVFLLAKQEKYFYDAEAVKERAVIGYDYDRKQRAHEGQKTDPTNERNGIRRSVHMEDTPRNDGDRWRTTEGGVSARGQHNLRSVWNIATQPYSGAHFATFPEKLVEPCIRAGTSERGVCCQCGAAWERVTRQSRRFESGSGKAGNPPNGKNGSDYEQAVSGDYDIRMGPVIESQTLGWRPTCLCPNQHGETRRAIVLDPFGGSGTVGRVATKLGRESIMLDIGYRDKYAPLAVERNSRVQMELV